MKKNVFSFCCSGFLRQIFCGRRRKHAKNAPSKFPDTAFIHPYTGASHGHLKAHVGERLEEIVKRVSIESADRMLIVGGYKDELQ